VLVDYYSQDGRCRLQVGDFDAVVFSCKGFLWINRISGAVLMREKS
jgi:hypothetical protein